jgi:hypothetical protein
MSLPLSWSSYVVGIIIIIIVIIIIGVRGGAVVAALRYKPEGRGFDSRWCH